jgi:hypothetical protein
VLISLACEGVSELRGMRYAIDPLTLAVPQANKISGMSFTEVGFHHGEGEWGVVTVRSGRSILPDLKNLALPEEVKNQADVIFNKMIYRVRRGKVRAQLLFFAPTAPT